jgi:hypothetical protein
LGSVLIGLWGICFALAGIVFTDAEGNPTETALALHSAVLPGFVFVIAGILLLSGVFVRDARWASFYPVSLALGFAALVGFADAIAILVEGENFIGALGPGIIQRVIVGTVVLWMMLAAIRLRSIAKSSLFTTPSG